MEYFKQELERERTEKRILWSENRNLRSSDHRISGNQISIKQLRDRAQEAERHAEEAERRTEEVKRLTEQAFPDLPKGSSQIPGIPTASTAPPIQQRHSPIQQITRTTWDQLSEYCEEVVFPIWSSDDESDEEQNSKPEVKATTPVAAGKQPERPSSATEASSAARDEPRKPTGTQSYAGATVAPPPMVEVGSAQTAQSSPTVLQRHSKGGSTTNRCAASQSSRRERELGLPNS